MPTTVSDVSGLARAAYADISDELDGMSSLIAESENTRPDLVEAMIQINNTCFDVRKKCAEVLVALGELPESALEEFE